MDPNDRTDFEHETARLRLKGGDPEPERRLSVIGVIAMVAGLALLVFALFGTRGAPTVEAQNDYLVLAPLGLGLCLVGSVVWARNSLSRYLRFWLVRLIYEQRSAVARRDAAIAPPEAAPQAPQELRDVSS
jgi:hypothetical protein